MSHSIGWYDITRFPLYEASIDDLFKSTVATFPGTKKRQNSIDMIAVDSLGFVPYKGMRTLLCNAVMRGEGFRNPNERKLQTYKTLIMFKDVKYEDASNQHNIALMDKNGVVNYLRPVDHIKKDCLVRCSCPDFRFRFAPYNKKVNALYGREPNYVRKTLTRPSVNPKKSEGLCKHIMQLAHALKDSGIIL